MNNPINANTNEEGERVFFFFCTFWLEALALRNDAALCTRCGQSHGLAYRPGGLKNVQKFRFTDRLETRVEPLIMCF